MFKHLHMLLCLMFVLVSAGTAPVYAQKTGLEMFFLIDCTVPARRVWDDKSITKTVAELVGKEIAALPENEGFGLGAYGHRVPDDCSDVEVLALAGTMDRSAIEKQLDSLDGLGSASLTRAVELVCQTFFRTEKETRLVVLTVGGDHCERHPCPIIERMMDMGFGFRVDVIALNPDPANVEVLKCMAAQGRGAYRAVDNAKELAAALSELRALAVTQQKSPADLVYDGPMGWLHLELPEASAKNLAGFRIRNQLGETLEYAMGNINGNSYLLPVGNYPLYFSYLGAGETPLVHAFIGTWEVKEGERYFLRAGHVLVPPGPPGSSVYFLDNAKQRLMRVPDRLFGVPIPWPTGTLHAERLFPDGTIQYATLEIPEDNTVTPTLSFSPAP